MKRIFGIVASLVILASMTACGSGEKGETAATKSQPDTTESEIQMGSQTEESSISSADSETNQENGDIESQAKKEQEEREMRINIQIGEHVLTAALVQNSSTEALLEMLSNGPITIGMDDYAGMEKVGSFPTSLPRNDEQISTDAGDLVLYQGNSFVIYYDTNSWSLTRLGRIHDVTKKELREILGKGSVTAVLSLPEE